MIRKWVSGRAPRCAGSWTEDKPTSSLYVVQGENPPCTAYLRVFCLGRQGQALAGAARPGRNGRRGRFVSRSYPIRISSFRSYPVRILSKRRPGGGAAAGGGQSGPLRGVPAPPPISHTSRNLRLSRKTAPVLALRVNAIPPSC